MAALKPASNLSIACERDECPDDGEWNEQYQQQRNRESGQDQSKHHHASQNEETDTREDKHQKNPCAEEGDQSHDQAGRSDAPIGIRSTAWDPDTRIVDKGAATLQILSAPAANSNVASAQAGQ